MKTQLMKKQWLVILIAMILPTMGFLVDFVVGITWLVLMIVALWVRFSESPLATKIQKNNDIL